MHSTRLEVKLCISSCEYSHPKAIVDCVIISSQDHWWNSASADLFTVFFKTSKHRKFVSIGLILGMLPFAKKGLDKCKLPSDKDVCQHYFKLHVYVVAKDLIQVNAHFCSCFSSLCAAGCILKTGFYADVNNIIFYFPAILKSAAAQNQCYFDATERKVVNCSLNSGSDPAVFMVESALYLHNIGECVKFFSSENKILP